MAWQARLARIVVTVLVAVLGALASRNLFHGLLLVEVLLTAIVVVAAVVNYRMGLGVAIVTAAVALAQNPTSLQLFLGLIAASLTAETIYELFSGKQSTARRICGATCRYSTIAGISIAYGGLLAAAFLGAILLAKTYEALLSIKLTGPLEDFWRLAAQSIAIRITVYTSMVALIYWVSSRLVAPLLQALAAPSHALARLLRAERRTESQRARSMQAWYHLILLRASGTLVALIVSPLSYPAANEILVLIRAGEAGLGIRAMMTAAVAWLLGMIGYNIGYTAAKALLLGNIRWKRVAIIGAATLAVLMLIAALSSPMPLHYLSYEAIMLLEPGKGNSLNDPIYIKQFYNYAESLEKYYRSTEELLRFLVKLLWS